MSAFPSIACKILTSPETDALRSKGSFAGSQLDRTDGFIHLSTREQVESTLARHFAGLCGLWLATIDLAKCGDTVRWEPSRDGALFPHLYGELTMNAVIGLEPLRDLR